MSLFCVTKKAIIHNMAIESKQDLELPFKLFKKQ